MHALCWHVRSLIKLDTLLAADGGPIAHRPAVRLGCRISAAWRQNDQKMLDGCKSVQLREWGMLRKRVKESRSGVSELPCGRIAMAFQKHKPLAFLKRDHWPTKHITTTA